MNETIYRVIGKFTCNHGEPHKVESVQREAGSAQRARAWAAYEEIQGVNQITPCLTNADFSLVFGSLVAYPIRKSEL